MNLNLKFTRTQEMKRKGMKFHSDEFPKRAKLYDMAHKRRVKGKPIDGKFFSEIGDEIKRMKQKGVR